MTDCLRLTAYVGERQRTSSRFATDAILDLFAERQVASSVVLRGIAGFGMRHVLRTDQSLSLSEDPPVVIAAVDTADVIDMLASDVTALIPRGLLTLEPSALLDAPVVKAGSGSVRLTVSIGRNRRIGGVPASHVVCDLLYRNHFAGATAFIGVDGTAHGERHRGHFFSRNLDVPMVIVAVGTAEQVDAVMPGLRTALEHPLITVEPEQLCKRDGTLLERPEVLPPGSTAWQKLMVQTSEATLHDGQPVHRALIRRLRQTRSASGATVLRGIWGFHGNHAPHGDKLIQFGRQVPVTTVIVDTPDNIRRSFDIVDELTEEHGLVSCQSVPAIAVLGEYQR